MTDRSPEAVAALAGFLWQVYHESDQPTFVALASRLTVGRGVLTRVFNGTRVPEVPLLTALLRELGAEHQIEHALALRRRIYQPGPATPAAPTGGRSRRTTTREPLEITYFDSTQSFYTALQERLETAHEEVCVTYIRELPPNRYANEAARRYFDQLLQWCRDEPGNRRVMRVIGVPTAGGGPQPRFTQWLREHHAETGNLVAYEAKVIEWSVATDSINMALVDRQTTFLTFSGMSGQEISGLSADSETFVERWHGYFRQLWNHATRLEAYLDARPPDAGDASW